MKLTLNDNCTIEVSDLSNKEEGLLGQVFTKICNYTRGLHCSSLGDRVQIIFNHNLYASTVVIDLVLETLGLLGIVAEHGIVCNVFEKSYYQKHKLTKIEQSTFEDNLLLKVQLATLNDFELPDNIDIEQPKMLENQIEITYNTYREANFRFLGALDGLEHIETVYNLLSDCFDITTKLNQARFTQEFTLINIEPGEFEIIIDNVSTTMGAIFNTKYISTQEPPSMFSAGRVVLQKHILEKA